MYLIYVILELLLSPYYEAAMLGKIFIIVVMLIILASLGSGLYFLIHDRGHGDRTVKALSWRIGLSVALFIILLIGFLLGIFTPHKFGASPSQPIHENKQE
jgi:Protein of unknown function (DUF2909)